MTLKYMAFANARLPRTDYRLAYGRLSSVASAYYALPEKPVDVAEAKFVEFDVGEGLRVGTFVQLCRIPRIIRSHGIEVAHFFATQLSLFGPLFATLGGARSIVTITGLGRSFSEPGWRGLLLRKLYSVLLRLSARLCDAVLFQNEDDMRQLDVLVSRKDRYKLRLIGSGIDSSFFGSRRESEMELPVCAMISRVHESKGVDDFIAIADRLRGTAAFVLIGPVSRGSQSLLGRVQEAEKDGILEFRGKVDDAEVRRVLAGCAVVVLPSRGEGLPRIALEASLAGAAVVAYDVPGCREAVPRRGLVAPYDVDALRILTESLLNSREDCDQAAAAGRALIEERFSVDRYVTRLDAVIAHRLMG